MRMSEDVEMGSGTKGLGRDYRERLIEEVRRCPVLYNTRHEQHRDIDARDRCWTDIANKLNANSEVLKREWKILRDSLRQSLRKSTGVRAVTKAGLPSKRWRFESRMAFLVPYMTKRGQRHAITAEDLKTDSREEDESCEPAGEEGAGEWAAGGEVDALELFFAAVCAGARRLPPSEQRTLKTQVLEALTQAEQRAEQQQHGSKPRHQQDDNPF